MFRAKLARWPKITTGDNAGLLAYADFLQQCVVAKESLPFLGVLSDPHENAKLVEKPPAWLSRKWARIAAEMTRGEDYPSFELFVSQMVDEAEVGMYQQSFQTAMAGDPPEPSIFQKQTTRIPAHSKSGKTGRALATSANNGVSCLFCEGGGSWYH